MPTAAAGTEHVDKTTFARVSLGGTLEQQTAASAPVPLGRHGLTKLTLQIVHIYQQHVVMLVYVIIAPVNASASQASLAVLVNAVSVQTTVTATGLAFPLRTCRTTMARITFKMELPHRVMVSVLFTQTGTKTALQCANVMHHISELIAPCICAPRVMTH